MTICLQVVKEDITPTLTKLREERSSYLEYQKIVRELEHLNKLCIAFQFMCADVSGCLHTTATCHGCIANETRQILHVDV